MPTNRIAQLEAFLKEDPTDPFNSYALALEYLKSDQEKAYELFHRLLIQQPSYLPTYYPFAHLLIEKKENDQAEEVFQKGMKAALAAGAQKTHRELQAAYNDWVFLRE